jgi:alpha-L-arabinofuranosidase
VLDWQDPTPTRVLAAETLTGPDLKAINTFDAPNRVRPQSYDAPRPGRSMTFRLPKASYTVVHLATA